MATYVPNATQATEPVESRTVESAALEFRTLKDSINTRIAALEVDDLRGLRVPESSVNPVPAAAARAGKVLAFDAAGNPTTIVVGDSADVSLRTDLAAAGGASLITYAPAGTGAVATTVQSKLRETVSVKDFGAVGNGSADDTLAINKAIAHCVEAKKLLDLTGASVGWRITGRLSFTGIPGIICSHGSPILVDVTGSYQNQWAVEFGDPAQTWNLGRSAACTIVGHLFVAASSRSAVLNGIYMKGSWLNCDHVMAYNFNGCGVFQDSVWDSTFTRVYTELCGNASTYSLRLDSTGDTHNTTHIVSLQCEQAYHKGMFIKTLRSVIDNIHAERLAVTSVNDGTPTYGYLNHYIDLTNSQINQAIIDCLPLGTAPDGTVLAATVANIKSTGSGAKISMLQASNSKVINDYGSHFTYDVLIVDDFVQRAPASYTEINNGAVTGTLDIEKDFTTNNCNIGELAPAFNALNITINGGAVASLNFAHNILGNITFNDVVLQTVSETKEPATSRRPVTFNDCSINVFNGAYNAVVKVVGGYVNTCALVSQSKAQFEGVQFGVFGYTGNTAFLTRGCIGPSDSTWSVPQNVSYPAGIITERVGYNSGGKIYQNTDGALTWAKIA